MFTGPKGGALRRAHFNNLTHWVETVDQARGAGPALPRSPAHRQPAAPRKPGPARKDLMARMGHDDMRAALIYQRATQRGGPSGSRTG